MNRFFQLIGVAVVASASLAMPAQGNEVSIELRNKVGDRRLVFSPELVRIEPGDTVIFVPTDKGHNTVSIDGMLPDGARQINVGFNERGSVTFDRPGIYGIKCTPHLGLGMVSLVVVGHPNGSQAILNAAAKLPPKAQARIQALLAEIDS